MPDTYNNPRPPHTVRNTPTAAKEPAAVQRPNRSTITASVIEMAQITMGFSDMNVIFQVLSKALDGDHLTPAERSVVLEYLNAADTLI